MPFVLIRVAGPTPLTPGQILRLQTQTTRLMATALRKTAELTAVLVEQAPLHGWSVGGAPVSIAAHLDVKVTRNTNSAEEKERFIAATTALLHEILGDDLPVATYVVVDEIAADAWGYGGLSQEQRRRLASSLNAA